MHRGQPSPSQFDVKINNSPRGTIDGEVDRTSRALHHYLMGQLSYGQENYNEAIVNFTKASELIDTPAPILHVKLAELHVRKGELEEALKESRKALEQQPDNSYNLLLLAGILESSNRDVEAEPIYRKLIERNPDMLDAYILLASLYSKTKENDKAIELLQRLHKRIPNETIVSYYLGRAYESDGKLAEAEKYFLAAYQAESQNIKLAIDLLRIQLKRSKYQAAKSLCEKILEKDPENVIARRVMGELLIGENRLDEAVAHLRVLETVEEDASETRFRIALIQIERQNFQEAVRELSLILAKKPEHSQARYYLASVYAGSGRKKEAVEELFKVKPEEKMYVKSRTLAAFILRQDGDLRRAEQAVREALAADSSNKIVFGYLVLILREQKKYSEAANLLEEALEKTPGDEDYLFSYALVMHDLNKEDASLEYMEKVLASNPKHSDALNYIAYSLAEKGQDLPRAKELVTKALEIKPNDGYYLDTLGWVHYQSGDYPQAVEVLAKAVGATSDDMLIMEHFGDALIKVDQHDKAMDVYRSALAGHDPQDEEKVEIAERIKQKLSELEKFEQKRTSRNGER